MRPLMAIPANSNHVPGVGKKVTKFAFWMVNLRCPSSPHPRYLRFTRFPPCQVFRPHKRIFCYALALGIRHGFDGLTGLKNAWFPFLLYGVAVAPIIHRTASGNQARDFSAVKAWACLGL